MQAKLDLSWRIAHFAPKFFVCELFVIMEEVIMVINNLIATRLKGLSHQGCVLTATARRPKKFRTPCMVRAVGSPTAPWALRGTSRSPWRCHCVSTASSRRVFGACTACALSVIVSIEFSRRLHGVATATIALPRRSYCVHRRLQGDATAITLRCEQSQQNCIKAA